MAVESYPHIKMGVRDESIYIGLDTEILPLDMPLYMMKTQKGDIGKPIWCPTYQYACQKFGVDTFNKRSKYWSEAAYFLLKTLVSNGAFIMRVAEETAAESMVCLECGIRHADVPQWERNSITGQFILNDDGTRVAIGENGKRITSEEGVTTLVTQEYLDNRGDNKRYKLSTDTKIAENTTYYYRDYKTYKHIPFTGVKAASDCVLYKGVLDADAYVALGISTAGEFTAAKAAWTTLYTVVDGVYTAVSAGASFVADTQYYKKGQTSEDIVKVQQFKTLTPEFCAANFIFRMGTAADFIPTEDTSIDDDKTYYVKNAVTGSYDEVDTPDVADIAQYYESAIDVLLPVENTKELDKDASYRTVEYTKFIGKLFVKDDDILEINTYYTRTPVYAAGYAYAQLSQISWYDDSKENDTAIGVIAAGDEIDGESNILHYVTFGDPDSKVYAGNVGQLYTVAGTLVVGDIVPQATMGGYELQWRAVRRNAKALEARPLDSADPDQSAGFTWWPMMAFSANNPGEWGNSFGFRLFYDRSNNSIPGIQLSGAIKYSFSPLELKTDDTTPTAIVNAYGESVVVGTMKENVFDPTTGLEITLKKLIPAQYSGSRTLPCSVILIPENFDKVGKKLFEAEQDAVNEISTLFGDLEYWDKDEKNNSVIKTFVDKLFAGTDYTIDGVEVGYMANCVSCVAGDKVPYFASCVTGTYDEAANTINPTIDVIDMASDSWFHMLGGKDGAIEDWDIERYIRAHIDATVAGTQDYLIDYLRCPYNNVIDTGVSIKTKKAYLDFMGVRDNLTVFLTPQQIWKSLVGNVASVPSQLSRYEDESVGAALRSYGLLMREDIENGTEANRCIIFLASGINSDHSYANDGLCASTLWVALKNADYLHGTKILREPIERPYSEINCYDGGMTWTAASEETRSRCWNAGLNYSQYCDQTSIHYASVRSIYRYDTSVLCDMGTVRAVTFCKDIIRREWAIWAGSKRPASELNARISKNLNEKCAAMLNNKYIATANVYQTDEDKKYGYVRHVDLELESPSTNRVWLATIICKREGFDPNASED